MDSRERIMFDLNEFPSEADESIQSEKSRLPTSVYSVEIPEEIVHAGKIVNNMPSLYSPSLLGLQSVGTSKSSGVESNVLKDKMVGDQDRENALKPSASAHLACENSVCSDREEGEWSDTEGPDKFSAGNGILMEPKSSEVLEVPSVVKRLDPCVFTDNFVQAANFDCEPSSNFPSQSIDKDVHDKKSTCILSAGRIDNQESLSTDHVECDISSRQNELKDKDPILGTKRITNPMKRKIDHRKEAMLGKKRKRQVVLINMDEAKQAAPNRSSTPRRNLMSMRSEKEVTVPPTHERDSGKVDNAINGVIDQNQSEAVFDEVNIFPEPSHPKPECNGDRDLSKHRRLNGENDFSAESLTLSKQGSYKQLSHSRQVKNPQFSGRMSNFNNQYSTDSKFGNKKLLSAKKPGLNNVQYNDTSVERMIREVTNDKFWDRQEESGLQCVPGRFDSVEEYVRVFEPLLFEECRAQLYSTYEESIETNVHIMVKIRNVERRERGWYDVVVLPLRECKWTFKEGDVAVLSTPRPGTVRYKRASTEEEDGDMSGRVAGTVRRHIPLDVRDPSGAILHFFVGDTYEALSKADDDHITKKLLPGSTWHLTVLGSLATTQREYVALHAFGRLNPQMQNAILKPSPDFFPNYEQHTPAIPDCFTQNFVDHLHKTFNGPQLAAIKWAAMHTAAGTNTAMARRQDPWPFTLVQGPPGTGKTHTVWGMLNVIHLVQYQHYYTSLLKKLAPQSYKHAADAVFEGAPTGSIDEVLYNMDQNLFRSLSKLCPKPRMLVCAPSNAATDELLTRVLDRGFIDGEMKVYRPDVARVGVDSLSRAAQAVSVERRTDQLLGKSREDVARWMQDLRGQEAYFAAQIADLQNKLSLVAADGRLQGSVGVDPDVLVARDQNRDALLQSLAAAVESRDKVLVEISRLLILEARFRGGGGFNMDEARANLEASFANEAEIVFTTVSSSGRKLFSRLTHGFDMVVIDEAAQASEVAVLPPLTLGAPRCVLVGDPQQLPATVISKAAGTLLYSRSLFERFQQAGCPTMLLSVQYRMHPQIRDFPSRYFYHGRLTDSESVASLPDEAYHRDPLLRPYLFFDVTHGRESHRGGSVSYQNIHEAQLCFQLYEHLLKTLKSLGLGRITVGIITPYKLQLKCLQHEFAAVLRAEEGKDIYINTVDAFQGQERDVIIMSCVRASNHGVGFVADIRRMNVALTRARRALWVMGNANSLMQSDDWDALIADAKARKCFVEMDSLPNEFAASRKGSSSAVRSGRSASLRRRLADHSAETKAEDAEASNANAATKNGGYRQHPDDLDDGEHKTGDAWHHRRHNSFGVVAKRDS